MSTIQSKTTIVLVVALLLVTVVPVQRAYAFPASHWKTPSFATGERLEVLRDFVCFGEGKAGERTVHKAVKFSDNVISAEVFLSGFNTWYEKDGHDHEVLRDRIDLWVCGVSKVDKRVVGIKCTYSMRDENTGGSDDYNFACVGFTVIALTKSGEIFSLPDLSTQGDLAADDWCYDLNLAAGTITFYPIVKNVGCADWASAHEGTYKIGVSVGTVHTEVPHTLPASPLWMLGIGESVKLDGITRPFAEGNTYSLVNLWVLHHPEDTNPGNDSHPGVGGVLTGKDFLSGGKMAGKMCK